MFVYIHWNHSVVLLSSVVVVAGGFRVHVLEANIAATCILPGKVDLPAKRPPPPPPRAKRPPPPKLPPKEAATNGDGLASAAANVASCA
mmetsp:Transcript_12514/g.12145  ORF Transcript_12514/g.12145 Transcript_12514/m.12145 type:complete len:89 (+) Transcript_12514:299-565(+)